MHERPHDIAPFFTAFFRGVLQASWQGSLAIGLVLLVRRALGAQTPARSHSLLWFLVLVRLLVPASRCHAARPASKIFACSLLPSGPCQRQAHARWFRKFRVPIRHRTCLPCCLGRRSLPRPLVCQCSPAAVMRNDRGAALACWGRRIGHLTAGCATALPENYVARLSPWRRMACNAPQRNRTSCRSASRFCCSVRPTGVAANRFVAVVSLQASMSQEF